MRLRIAAIAMAVCAAAAIVLPAVAQAAASPAAAYAASVKAPTGARVTSVKILPRASSAASTCSYTFDGDTGWFICGTNILTIGFVGGTIQAFGIGANKAVYTAWGSASGQLDHAWESMGGQASDAWCAWDDRSSNAVIQVKGPQGSDVWCRYRTGSTGAWGAWFQCDSWTTNLNTFSSAGEC